MDERALVVLAQRGDASAFTALVERYYGMVYGLAYAYVHARPAASVAAGGSSLKNSAMAPARASDSPAYRIQ